MQRGPIRRHPLGECHSTPRTDKELAASSNSRLDKSYLTLTSLTARCGGPRGSHDVLKLRTARLRVAPTRS
jgi:hypothetical protein